MGKIILAKHIVTGVILAGGQARRMHGQDKGLVELGGCPMVQYVLESIAPQVGYVIINANRNREIYGHFGCPVVADEFAGFCGPLAGIASSMRVVDTPLMVTAPCDSPFVPADMVERLYMQLVHDDADISVAHNGDRIQPVFVLLKTGLLESMLTYLRQGERKIDKWFKQHKMTLTDFSDKPDTFLNINTPKDLELIEAKLKKQNET